MTFTITEITRCAGGGHWTVTANVNSQLRTFELHKSDLDVEPEEIRNAALHRVRSAILEANASTFVQVQTALINKEFKV